jgi:hypothetical protein
MPNGLRLDRHEQWEERESVAGHGFHTQRGRGSCRTWHWTALPKWTSTPYRWTATQMIFHYLAVASPMPKDLHQESPDSTTLSHCSPFGGPRVLVVKLPRFRSCCNTRHCHTCASNLFRATCQREERGGLKSFCQGTSHALSCTLPCDLFPATHYSCGGLTARNKHELPQCLFYDPLFGQVAESLGLTNCSLDQPALKAVVSPKFGEWLMGLPQGWTSPYLPVNFAVLGAHIVSQQPVLEHKHHVLSLFSGCGALDYALSPWCHSLAYCEIDIDAQSVLQARMKDGSLTHGKIFGDIRSLTRGTLMKELGDVSVDGLVFGFPCVDTCRAGKMKGIIDGPQSNLVWEALRLAEELRVAFMFIENVDNTRFLRFGGAQCLVDALGQAGFRCTWVSVGAVHVGCPQRRKRWFLLATRGHMLHQLFATPPDDSLREHIAQNSGLAFNGGRPPPEAWMLPREEYKHVKHCLTQLGNCVIPAQVIVAARVLSSAVWCQ